MDKIIASIATIPDREKMLRETVNSLIDQVDEIHLNLNLYNEVPDWTKHDKIIARITDNRIGDGYKFNQMDKQGKAYIFTCDDDLIYPANYVENTVYWIEKLNRSCVVTYHGRTLSKPPYTTYYGDKHRLNAVQCLKPLPFNLMVAFGGTGVMAYHTDTIKIPMNIFKEDFFNADVFVGVYLDRMDVPTMALFHRGDFFKYQHPRNTIFENYSNNEQKIVDYLNKYYESAF